MSEEFEIYTIGDRTAELVFRAAGITNVSDLQEVLDQVEVALKQSADQERDKISRWLRAKSQNLHSVMITDTFSSIGRGFCSKMLVQIAAEIEGGGGSDFTPRILAAQVERKKK